MEATKRAEVGRGSPLSNPRVRKVPRLSQNALDDFRSRIGRGPVKLALEKRGLKERVGAVSKSRCAPITDLNFKETIMNSEVHSAPNPSLNDSQNEEYDRQVALAIELSMQPPQVKHPADTSCADTILATHIAQEENDMDLKTSESAEEKLAIALSLEAPDPDADEILATKLAPEEYDIELNATERAEEERVIAMSLESYHQTEDQASDEQLVWQLHAEELASAQYEEPWELSNQNAGSQALKMLRESNPERLQGRFARVKIQAMKRRKEPEMGFCAGGPLGGEGAEDNVEDAEKD